MSTLSLKTIAIAMAMSLVSAGTAASQTSTLRYSSWLPGNHWLNTKVMLPWTAELENATDGRVKIELLPKTVGTPPTQFDVCRDGLADVCVIVAGYTPGRFAATELGELPFMGDDPRVLAPAFDRICASISRP